jgi:plastocyanin
MRKLAVALFVLLVGSSVLAACGDDSSGGGSSDEGGTDTPVDLSGEVTNKGTEDLGDATELELEADDFYFEPTFVKATPGTTVTVTVENEGDATHTFTIDDAGVDEEVSPGDSAQVDVAVPDSGIANFYCRFHRSQGMQGAVFTQAGQSGGSPATEQPAGGGAPPAY